MKHIRHSLAFLLLIPLFMVVACDQTQSQPPIRSESKLSKDANASPSDDVVNAAFLVTADQLRKAFDDAETRGEKKQSINIGEEKSINTSALNPIGGTETLKLSILFLTPLEQVRAAGYQFGLVAKQRTPEDRKAFEDVSISNALKATKAVNFRVFLQQPSNEDATIPSINFVLLDESGSSIDPAKQPTEYVTQGPDLIGAVALAQNGQELSFPLFAGSTPLLTNKMKTMSLIVIVDGAEQTLGFHLK